MRSSATSGADGTGPAWRNSIDGLPLALVRARECVMAHFRHLLRRYNLTEPQWRVLKTMDDVTSIELSELARKSALLMPSLSRIVRELELRGYMTKAADPRDMRRMLATLTERGRCWSRRRSPECEAVNAAIRTAMGQRPDGQARRPSGAAREADRPLDLRELTRHGRGRRRCAGKQRGRPRKVAAAS